MKDHLNDFSQVLVYVLECVINGQPRSVVLVPNVESDNAILEETFNGSGIYRGRSVSGGMVEVPVAAVTNVFASWWKLTNRTNQGVDTYYVDDAVVERKVENAHGQPEKWDENGTLKDVEGKDSLPKDAKSSRIIRGR